MSREIKFRLYSKGAERYIDYYSVGFSSSGGVKNMSNKNGVGPIFPEDYIVEQYTGLKDKNGKEIYEGDIIETVDDGGYKKHSFAVGWHDPFACFHLYYLDGRPSAFAINYVANIGKVIGNIYENPELLGGEE